MPADFNECSSNEQTCDGAWQLIQGIETLSLQLERHVQNAQEVAEWLDASADPARSSWTWTGTS